MEQLVATALSSFSCVLLLVYYDDVLPASPDPDRVQLATRACVQLLKDRGLLPWSLTTSASLSRPRLLIG